MTEYIVTADGMIIGGKVKGELVRCKDCKYNDDGECVIKAGWFPVKPNWFCADGERIEKFDE